MINGQKQERQKWRKHTRWIVMYNFMFALKTSEKVTVVETWSKRGSFTQQSSGLDGLREELYLQKELEEKTITVGEYCRLCIV